MINGDDIYGEKTFVEGFELLNKVNSDTSIIGGLKLIDTLPETGKVNRGVVFVENDSVIGMKEVLGIDVKNNKQISELANMIANVNLQNEALKGIWDLNENFKNINKNDMKIESLLPDHINKMIVSNDFKFKMDYFIIKNKIIGITNPGDETKVKKIINTM